MRKIFCDVCKNEIVGRLPSSFSLYYALNSKKWEEVCPQCANELENIIKEFVSKKGGPKNGI